eukprot:3810109-Rhodomonas_salina.1
MRERIRREGDTGYLWSSPSFSVSSQVRLSAGRYSLLVRIADALGTATFSSELALELAKMQLQAVSVFDNSSLAVAGDDAGT